MPDNDFKTLKKDDAIALWEKGKDAWNAWVDKNPDYNIDFRRADFSGYEFVDFSGLHFPNGSVDFSQASFGDGFVNFSGAKFGEGSVAFFCANFGDGDVFFIGASFGDGNVDFSEVNFGKGDVFLYIASFGKGTVNFSKVNFGIGDVNFSGVNFGDGIVSFSGAQLKGISRFTNLKNMSGISTFSFQYATFDGPFHISCADQKKDPFLCLVDLTSTKASHHVSLAGLKCELLRQENRPSTFWPKGDWATQKTAIDSKDEERARRLKELAEANKDHEKAKEFQIMEWQAKRTTHKNPLYFLAETEFWYEKLSGYGGAIDRPLNAFVSVLLSWAGFYVGVSGFKKFFEPFVYSAAQMVPFLPSSRGIREGIEESLFKDMPWMFDVATLSQNLLAFVLLFLLGLGLRFRYRI